MYESMIIKVDNVLERGKVADDYITGEEELTAFTKWTNGFTRQDHPAVIQVICYLMTYIRPGGSILS